MERSVQFTLPSRVYFEKDYSYKMGGKIAQYGRRPLLVNVKSENKNPEELSIVKNGLTKHTEGAILYDDIESTPTIDQLDSAIYFAKKSHIDCVVAFGGIKTFYTAKAVALLANNSLFTTDLLNGRGVPKIEALPLITIPVEPTMGEELTHGFVIHDSKNDQKMYYEDESLFPRAVFYDSKISQHLNSDDAAKIGGAMLVYAIESILAPQSNPFTSTLILRAIDSIKKNLPYFYQDPGNEKTLENILWSSAMIGASIISSPVGVTWAIAMALSSHSEISFHHGLTLMLPHVMEYYLTMAPVAFINVAKSLGEDVKDISVIEAAIKAVEGVRRTFLEVNLPTRLSEYNIEKKELSNIARDAVGYPHMENTNRKLVKNEVESILLACY